MNDPAPEAHTSGAPQPGGERVPIRRALVSVYDKAGLVEFGKGLHEAGVEIVSTGSTAAVLEGAGVPVIPVAQVTNFPERLDGRVKTLHPAIHAGILADRRREEHRRELDELGIAGFDLVVVNLYPFRETVASGVDAEGCVEQIDIGGPAMLRAAAKNHGSVAVVVEPSGYGDVLAAVRDGGFGLAERRRLAALAFQHTASYDIAVASYLTSALAPELATDGFPNWVGAGWTRSQVLRYGENPHQRAALYAAEGVPTGLAQAELLHGKPMSYNNYVDADAAWRAAHDFDEPCVAIVKHANPCGIAEVSAAESAADPIAEDPIAEAYRKALACDPVSAFGGVVAANRPVSAGMAERIAEVFTEVVLAPDYQDGALEILTRRKNVRLLRCPPLARTARVEWRSVSGGLLMQAADLVDAPGDDPGRWELKAGRPADAEMLADLAFAWRAVRSVKSNAILLASGRATVGVGMGQVNRVDAVRLAVARAGERVRGSAAASDAFFPFADGLEALADAGVAAVVEPGGSVRDEEAIVAAERAGLTLYFTGTRHFFH